MRILQCRYASVCGCCPIFFENKANWNLFLEKFVRACKKLRSYPRSSKIKEKKKTFLAMEGSVAEPEPVGAGTFLVGAGVKM